MVHQPGGDPRASTCAAPTSAGTPSDLSGDRRTASTDIGFVLADGLSPRALVDHGVALLAALVAELRRARTRSRRR